MKKGIKLLFCALICLTAKHTYSQDTTLLITYNLLKFNEQSTNRTPYFKAVIDSMQPDILVCQEMISLAAYNVFYQQVMDSTYSQGDFIDGPDTDNVIFYKNQKFEYLSHTPIPTALRNISEFKLVHLESKDTLIIFSMHLKAGNTSVDRINRAEEVNILRSRTNQLKPNDYFVVCGDFNIYSANEQAYNLLLLNDSITSGHFIDPIVMQGTWNNPAYSNFHTQSTRKRQFGGGAFGGLDDRFDLVLYSESISKQGGITYLMNSTWPIGNDGNHYKDSINAPPNTIVSQNLADCLHYASDHLPVVAKFNFENRTTEVSLSNGWNGLSLPVNPTSTDLAQLTSLIGENFIALANLSGTYYPAGGIATITEWDYTSGYFVKAADDLDFVVQGKAIVQAQIEIKEGWNLMPVLNAEPIQITDLLSENLDDVIII